MLAQVLGPEQELELELELELRPAHTQHQQRCYPDGSESTTYHHYLATHNAQPQQVPKQPTNRCDEPDTASHQQHRSTPTPPCRQQPSPYTPTHQDPAQEPGPEQAQELALVQEQALELVPVQGSAQEQVQELGPELELELELRPAHTHNINHRVTRTEANQPRITIVWRLITLNTSRHRSSPRTVATNLSLIHI